MAIGYFIFITVPKVETMLRYLGKFYLYGIVYAIKWDKFSRVGKMYSFINRNGCLTVFNDSIVYGTEKRRIEPALLIGYPCEKFGIVLFRGVVGYLGKDLK